MGKKESEERAGKGNESLQSNSFWWFICSPEPWLETGIFSRAVTVACPKVKINKIFYKAKTQATVFRHPVITLCCVLPQCQLELADILVQILKWLYLLLGGENVAILK